MLLCTFSIIVFSIYSKNQVSIACRLKPDPLAPSLTQGVDTVPARAFARLATWNWNNLAESIRRGPIPNSLLLTCSSSKLTIGRCTGMHTALRYINGLTIGKCTGMHMALRNKRTLNLLPNSVSN